MILPFQAIQSAVLAPFASHHLPLETCTEVNSGRKRMSSSLRTSRVCGGNVFKWTLGSILLLSGLS